ncbi:MAG: restriction endonuclease [Spirosoma sp.]|nr:restriction endonuclease [Spirosoma sp.]
MRIVEEKFFIREGTFSKSATFEDVLQDIRDGISSITYPAGSQGFSVNPVKNGNGVKPIKENLIAHLRQRGWRHESRFKIIDGINAGPIDSVISTEHGEFAIEWETGNISSSHRALNKIAVGIIQKHIIGGILIVPERDFAQYLTDRIGNYREIKPYFVMYDSLQITEGIMGVISVTYDKLDPTVPLIPKGNDGNSKKRTPTKK